jgi:UDP-N-acetylglucosamine 4,6-dehydratase
MFKNKTILITGGTGSFGKACAKFLLKNYNLKKLIIFSRDELKQSEMSNSKDFLKYKNLRFFIGDIRDFDRLKMAFRNVDYIIHAAALKQVPTAEYNPIECIKTNIIGAENIINASIENNVKKVICLSTDKAVNPINLYGASKLAADKLFQAAKNLVGKSEPSFSIVRYGNVSGSRGSVIPFFLKLKEDNINEFPITDLRMTRFWITLDEAVKFVLNAFKISNPGEILVPKIPSIKIVDLVKAINSKGKIKVVGIRPGEKLHELLISDSENNVTREEKNYYIVQPSFMNMKKISGSKKVSDGFAYSSLTNKKFLSIKEIKKLIKKNNSNV